MTQSQTLAILNAGHSIFLTGAAGSGKTYVLSQFIESARVDGRAVAVTASTGLAATHLGGTTIHSWAGIGIADELHKRHVKDMPKSRYDQLLQTDILVIDEVSMLHDFRLDMVDMLLREVRSSSDPFGGIQVILSGDFFQLPPVNREDSRQGSFVVQSEAWAALDPVVCYLDEQYRQEDDMLLEILTALRANDLRRRHIDALKACYGTSTASSPVTELYTRNIDVDTINLAKLDAMDGEVHEYIMQCSGKKGAVESMKKSCLAPERLQLKTGAFVMFVKNSPDKKYVNGTLGTVVGFDEESGNPLVKTKIGRLVEAKPESWEMRDGEKKIATLVQIPLRLAWAITVHKSQGMTLDGAYIDLSNAFVPGMGYVALSRVRNLETLILGGLNRMALLMHEEAYLIDELLRSKSHKDLNRYAHLEASYLEAEAEKQKQPKQGGNSWADKLQRMRKSHPNAYKPWRGIEDTTLLNGWAEGKNITELSKLLGRHEGSIRARLKKHLGEKLII